MGAEAARALAVRLGAVKGSEGGRLYINEACNFFAPPRQAQVDFTFLGRLEEDDQWFYPPEGFDDSPGGALRLVYTRPSMQGQLPLSALGSGR